MPELLTNETKEVLDRHYNLRNRTISEMKLGHSFPYEQSPQRVRRSNSTANFRTSSPQNRRPTSGTVGSSTLPPMGSRPSIDGGQSLYSDHSTSHVGVPSLVDKLRRGAQPVMVESVRLSDVSRASSATGGFSMYSDSASSLPFERYSTRSNYNKSALSSRPITVNTKTDYDHEKVEQFAEIETRDELPRSIPRNYDQFNVDGHKGLYSYDGNVWVLYLHI